MGAGDRVQFRRRTAYITSCCVIMLSGVVLLVSVRAQAPQHEQIIFMAYQERNAEIYAMDVSGRNLRNLTNHPAADEAPAWSPDGKRIAFMSNRDRASWDPDIYVMDADGSNPRNLTNHPEQDNMPAWSPNGREIAFFSSRSVVIRYEPVVTRGSGIYIMDAEGGSVRHLAKGFAPSWSPDGRSIVYTGGASDNYQDICVIDVNGKNRRNLTNHPAMDHYPDWSPDGKRIAFHSMRDGKCEIYVIDADGKNLRNLQVLGANPAWSPDGREIVFSINGGISVMDANGRNVRNLVKLTVTDFPDWFSPGVIPFGKLMGTWGWLKGEK